MNKKIKCVIFDLDGTLIDSGPDLLDSLNYVLKKNKLKSISRKVLGNLVGGGAEAMIRKGYDFLNEKIVVEKIPEMVDCFIDFYYQNCTKKTLLYDNVFESLKNLRSKKFKMGLCTNKKQHLTEKIVEQLNIKDFFDEIVGSRKSIALKPETDMLKFCLENLESSPEESIMIGDSNNDIIPANKMNMTSVFVKYGYGKLDESVTPNFSIDNINEILRILNS